MLSKGFTLLELIIVIVLLGIMSVGAGLLISRPIDAYSDQLRRQQLVDSAEMTVHKIETDIRGALPNSIRLDTSAMPDSWTIEMVHVLDGARYRDQVQPLTGFNLATHILDFTTADDEFNLLGTFSSLTSASLPNTYRVVIYNTNPTLLYSDAVTTDNSGIISYPEGISLSTVSAAGAAFAEDHISLPSAFRFTSQSPTQRLFIVSGPVSYTCDKTTGYLTRFSDYSYQAIQVTAYADLAALPGVREDRVATQLAGCQISYQPGTAQRSGLVSVDLTLTDNKNESVRLLHQVHVDNVP